MAIVKVQLKTHRQRKDGTFPIVIYVYETKPQYVYTGYAVLSAQFKDGQSKWVRGHPDAALINAKIEDLRREVVDSIFAGVGYIPGGNNAKASGNFCEFLRKEGERYKANDQIDMGLKCLRMAEEFKEIAGRDIYSKEITNDFIEKYKLLCKRNNNVKNTIMRKLKNLRTIYKSAIDSGIASPPNPFASIIISFDPVDKKKLTAEEIIKIEDLALPAGFTFHARNAFLFAFYSQGMRFENVCLMKADKINQSSLNYQMNKGKKFREIATHPKLQRIIDYYLQNPVGPYLFPFFKEEIRSAQDLRNKKGSINAMVNLHLKMIASLAGIEKELTFHISRHSFAHQAKKKGINTSIIQDALGHSTSKMTEVYLDALDDDDINDAVKAVYE